MKLYVKNIVREPKDTLYTFLSKVFNVENIYGCCTVNTTYLDPEFKEIQCVYGKHRSFDDIVLISKTYFKVSDKVVAKSLIKILNKKSNFKFVLCNTALKWILNSNLTVSESIKYCFKYDNSDLKTSDPGKGKYSFDDIITLAGLTKEDIKIN